jgi:hypothetical protein
MSEIAYPISTSCLFSPRTANYVAALIREGDKFDYAEWLQQVREEKAQAKRRPPTITEQIVSEETDAAVSTFGGTEASPHGRLFNGRVPISLGAVRLRRKTLNSTSVTRITRRLERIRDAWNEFQANRARDAVYGYLEARSSPITRCGGEPGSFCVTHLNLLSCPSTRKRIHFQPLFAALVTTTPTAKRSANGLGHYDTLVDPRWPRPS